MPLQISLLCGFLATLSILDFSQLQAAPTGSYQPTEQKAWAGDAKQLPASVEYAVASAAISAAMNREVQAMDNQDWPMLASAYTDDACFAVTIGNGKVPDVVQRMLEKPIHGASDVRDFVSAIEGPLKPNTFNHHVITNFWLEKLDGKRAVARAYVTVGASFTGRYEEDFLRGKDGIWRIQCKRVFVNNFNVPAAAN